VRIVDWQVQSGIPAKRRLSPAQDEVACFADVETQLDVRAEGERVAVAARASHEARELRGLAGADLTAWFEER
jgi:hypothetical protein